MARQDARTARVGIRVSGKELAAIRRRADLAELSVSDYLRRRALEDSDRPVVCVDVGVLRELLSNLKKCGSNLNQCARALNMHHRPDQIESSLKASFEAVAEASQGVSTFIADARRSI